MVAAMTDYRCGACRKTVQRESHRLWMISWCESTGRMTRIWRLFG